MTWKTIKTKTRKTAKKAQTNSFLEAAHRVGVDEKMDVDDVMRRLAAQEKFKDRSLKGQKRIPSKQRDSE